MKVIYQRLQWMLSVNGCNEGYLWMAAMKVTCEWLLVKDIITDATSWPMLEFGIKFCFKKDTHMMALIHTRGGQPFSIKGHLDICNIIFRPRKIINTKLCLVYLVKYLLYWIWSPTVVDYGQSKWFCVPHMTPRAYKACKLSISHP